MNFRGVCVRHPGVPTMNSRQIIRNIALPILLVLALTQCSGTVPEPDEIKHGNYTEEEVPDDFLRWAQREHKDRAGDPDFLRTMLRSFALSYSEETARRNRAFMVKEKWHSDLIEGLDQALVWGRAMRANPRQAYDLWKGHRDRAAQESRPAGMLSLLIVAEEAGIPEARFEWANYLLSRGGKGYRLRKLADEDYLPVQVDMVRRYTEGDGLEKDNAKAYYWLSRAFHNGAKVSDQHRRLGEILTADDFGKVASWYMIGLSPSP